VGGILSSGFSSIPEIPAVRVWGSAACCAARKVKMRGAVPEVGDAEGEATIGGGG